MITLKIVLYQQKKSGNLVDRFPDGIHKPKFVKWVYLIKWAYII